MFLFLHNYYIKPQQALRRAGYIERPQDKDFILVDGTSGRFHAHIIDQHTIKLHYDIFVEDRHWAPYLPIKVSQERKRISWYIAKAKFRRLSDKEFDGLRKRYSVYN